MEAELREKRRRLTTARRFMDTVALGVVIVFFGPCVPRRVQSVFGTPDEDALLARVFDVLPMAIALAGMVLVLLGTFRMEGAGFGARSRKLLRIAAVAGAFSVLGCCASLTLSVLGSVPSRSTIFALAGIAIVVAAFVWPATYARGLELIAGEAGLKLPSQHWRVTSWLAVASCVSVVGTMVYLVVAPESEPGTVTSGSVAFVPLMIVPSLLSLALVAGFMLATSATHKTLRTLERAAALRRRADQ